MFVYGEHFKIIGYKLIIRLKETEEAHTYVRSTWKLINSQGILAVIYFKSIFQFVKIVSFFLFV